MSKIAIIGLGPSHTLFDSEDFDISIGVNDVWRYHHTDYIVCLDYPSVFNAERYYHITNARPRKFYSQIVQWDSRNDFEKINLIAGYPDKFVSLETPGFYKSFCSPFVAAQVAYKLHGATEIHLFGVDLTNHPHLDRALCEKIKIHFTNLQVALMAKGVRMIVHGEGILQHYLQ